MRFKGNRHTVKDEKMKSKASMERESSEESDESDTTKESTCTRGFGAEMKSYPASVKKLDKLSDRTESSSSEDDLTAPEGFRLIDISVLAFILISAISLPCL